MKLFLIRFLVIGALYLLFRFALKWPEALLLSFVIEYVIEPAIVREMRKP